MMPRAVTAEEIRAQLEQHVDFELAGRAANPIIEQMLVAFNAADLPVGASMVCRAMVARAMLVVVSEWWADLTGLPVPITWKAISSYIDNPPAAIEGYSFIDPDLARGHG
jgi:hypothetical protein